jgi:hypothetical protein
MRGVTESYVTLPKLHGPEAGAMQACLAAGGGSAHQQQSYRRGEMRPLRLT